MAMTHTVELIEFKMKTQSMMNFAPMVFKMKQARRRETQLKESLFWSEETHKPLGPNFVTTVDELGNLHEIKIGQFLKEFQRIVQAMESNPGLIQDNFTLLQEGLVKVAFEKVMQLAYDKYAMQVKMRSRSGL